METTEDYPLRVETCNVTQNNKKKVALTAELVLLEVVYNCCVLKNDIR
jgi:hypothetical protein